MKSVALFILEHSAFISKYVHIKSKTAALLLLLMWGSHQFTLLIRQSSQRKLCINISETLISSYWFWLDNCNASHVIGDLSFKQLIHLSLTVRYFSPCRQRPQCKHPWRRRICDCIITVNILRRGNIVHQIRIFLSTGYCLFLPTSATLPFPLRPHTKITEICWSFSAALTILFSQIYFRWRWICWIWQIVRWQNYWHKERDCTCEFEHFQVLRLQGIIETTDFEITEVKCCFLCCTLTDLTNSSLCVFHFLTVHFQIVLPPKRFNVVSV